MAKSSFAARLMANRPVVIEPGAAISALNNDSYVAMVAPRIEQGGTVDVNGSVAYVAAEQADLIISNGLFDINVLVGTSDPNGVVHTGTTTGPSSIPTGVLPKFDPDAQAIYMVAIPKNTAITMLVGGNIGYKAAASAAVVNGNVVLSAGADVSVGGTATAPTIDIDRTATPSADANINIGPTIFTSDVEGFATNNITATTASVTEFIAVGSGVGTQDLNLEARNQIDINARGGGSVITSGDVNLKAGSGNIGGMININTDQIGFTDTIISGLLVQGNLIVDASASGADDFTIFTPPAGGIGEDATAGNINININGGGDIVVAGSAQFLASAQGGKGDGQNGMGQAGDIVVNMSSGTFNVTGTTIFDAGVLSAQDGKAGGHGPGLIGSDSIAGNITLNLSDGALNLGSTTFELSATASGGEAAGGAQSNDAAAGIFDMSITGGDHTIGTLRVDALTSATSSFNAAGDRIDGVVTRGRASLLVDGGTLTVDDVGGDMEFNLDVQGIVIGDPVDVGTITVQNGGTLTVTDNVSINTNTFGGGETVAGIGGSISILVDNGTFTMDDLFLDTSAQSTSGFGTGTLGEGRDFEAGDIDLVVQNGGTLSGDLVSLSAFATGNSALAGDGIGGDILIHANDGSMTFTGSFFCK